MKIGVMFGSPETTPGGRALKFYSAVRIEIRRIGSIKEGDETIGNRVRLKVAKNKVAPPFKRCEVDLLFRCGLSREGDLLELGPECEVITKSGAWYSYGETRLGQGRENSRQFLEENPDMAAEIEEKIVRNMAPALASVRYGEAEEDGEEDEAAETDED